MHDDVVFISLWYPFRVCIHPPPATPPLRPPDLAPRPPARRYGQAGGPREAAGGGRGKAGAKPNGRPEKARRRTVMTAVAVRYELRGIRAEIPRIRDGKALTPPKRRDSVVVYPE